MNELDAAKRAFAEELLAAKVAVAEALGWTLEHLDTVLARQGNR